MNRAELAEWTLGYFVPWLPRRARMFYYYRLLASARFPEVIHIENTNACNAKCIMCPRDELVRPIGAMSMKLFTKIIDECARRPEVKEVHLHGFGEATLDKRLPEKLRYAKSRRIRKTYFVTTASLLTKQLSRELILGGLDAIKFSFYGATKETYEKIQRQLNFETSRDNIRNFFSVRKELGRRNPSVSMQIVPMPENRHEYHALRTMWQSYLDPACGDHYEDFFLHNWVDGRDYNAMAQRKAQRRISCSLPLHLVQIHWNGDIGPCIYDSNGTLIMGSVAKDDMSIERVWNGDAFRQFRRLHQQGRFESIDTCNNCDQLRVVGTETPPPAQSAPVETPVLVSGGRVGFPEQIGLPGSSAR